MSGITDVIFFHSSKDSERAKELIGFLKTRQKLEKFTMWSPVTGDDENTALKYINGENRARIILLFHSQNFVADVYDENTIIAKVMPDIMDQHEKKLAQVIPVWLSYQSESWTPYQELGLLGIKNPDEELSEDEKLSGEEELIKNGKKPLSYWKSREMTDSACNFISNFVVRELRKIKNKENGGIPAPPVLPPLPPPPPDYSFLASLCNREIQTKEFETILNLKKQEKNRFGFVVHGRTEEDLRGYKERLEKIEINKILRTGRKAKVWLINLPAPESQSDRADLSGYFERTLMEEVFKGGENRTLSDVLRKLQSYKAPVMICYNFRTEHLRVVQPEKSFFNFWKRWKSLPPPNDLRTQLIGGFFEYWSKLEFMRPAPIISCLFFNYEVQFKENEEMNLKDDEKLNDEIENYLRNLEFNNYSNLSGKTLTKLPPISRGDIDRWVKKENIFAHPCGHEAKQFCEKCRNEFEDAVTKLYNTESEDRVPYQNGDTLELRIRMRALRPFLVEQLEKIIPSGIK